MKFSIKRKELKAMARFCAVKDVRYYLQGVQVVQDNRGTYIQSTNGHVLGRLLIDGESKPVASVILPPEALKTLAGTVKNSNEYLHFTIDGVKISVISQTCEQVFTAFDARFPDCDRVIPLDVSDSDAKPATFNPEYLMAFLNASNDLLGTKVIPSILQRGDQSAIVNIGVENFVGVIMPVRDKSSAFVPAFCRQPVTAPVADTVTE